MSMTIICESNEDLSIYCKEYNVVKFNAENIEEKYLINTHITWTTDYFDDFCVDAYDSWCTNQNNDNVYLMDFLMQILPVCTQVLVFYWEFPDLNDNISSIKTIFNDTDKFIEYVKSAIISDYRCEFNCWYKS